LFEKKKNKKMFVAFFGYPACPVNLVQNDVKKRNKKK
jgi:hypothetical protein